jgi:hypothetical protein
MNGKVKMYATRKANYNVVEEGKGNFPLSISPTRPSLSLALWHGKIILQSNFKHYLVACVYVERRTKRDDDDEKRIVQSESIIHLFDILILE